MREKGGYTCEFAVTFTLKPVMHRYPAEQQYDRSASLLTQELQSRGMRVTLVAELTKNADIHYHGIIRVPAQVTRDVNKYVKDMFRTSKIFGFSNIKMCDDLPGWIDYISKDLLHTHMVIGRRPILCDADMLIPTGMYTAYGIVEDNGEDEEQEALATAATEAQP